MSEQTTAADFFTPAQERRICEIVLAAIEADRAARDARSLTAVDVFNRAAPEVMERMLYGGTGRSVKRVMRRLRTRGA